MCRSTGSRDQAAQELIRKWDAAPQEGYLGGHTEVPSAAALVTSDGQFIDGSHKYISDLLVTTGDALHNHGGIGRCLLGLDPFYSDKIIPDGSRYGCRIVTPRRGLKVSV